MRRRNTPSCYFRFIKLQMEDCYAVLLKDKLISNYRHEQGLKIEMRDEIHEKRRKWDTIMETIKEKKRSALT